MEFVEQPARPLHVHPDLINPCLDRHIQRRQGRRPSHAIHAKILIDLILLHRSNDFIVVSTALALMRLQITTGHQTGTQLCDHSAVHARLE
ncbi:hypothetical protein D3C76_1302940 [compost metagenome]